MNQVILIGRLTADPEVRYTGEQLAVASFTVAVDRPKRADKDKETDFPRVKAFGKTAENIERYMSKGKMIAVQGRIQTGKYQKDDGTTVYTMDVIAERVQFLGGGEKTEKAESQEGIPAGFQVVDDDDCPF